MDDLHVYWTSIEFQYDKSSAQYDLLAGGFVFAFVSATDAREALDKFDTCLSQEGLIPIYVEFVSVYNEETEWEMNEQTEIFQNLVKEASQSTNVILDDFYAYEQEA